MWSDPGKTCNHSDVSPHEITASGKEMGFENFPFLRESVLLKVALAESNVKPYRNLGL